MSAGKPQTVIKKVKAYPIETALDLNGAKKPIEVILLTTAGFLARLKGPGIVHVGEYYTTSFELPVLQTLVGGEVRVIKTYDRSVDPKAKVVDRMAELHFESLTEEQRKNILSFLSAIGQK
ncbi:MAG: hypothetical protein KF799_05420 [Bdellovibrionales bacterium]|nr:hypothetical protein [Bdellovibrionales bacterium]